MSIELPKGYDPTTTRYTCAECGGTFDRARSAAARSIESGLLKRPWQRLRPTASAASRRKAWLSSVTIVTRRSSSAIVTTRTRIFTRAICNEPRLSIRPRVRVALRGAVRAADAQRVLDSEELQCATSQSSSAAIDENFGIRPDVQANQSRPPRRPRPYGDSAEAGDAMNPNAFEPGDVAILQNLSGAGAVFNGCECTVMHRCCVGDGYRVQAAAFTQICVDRHNLRRRPEPPDWDEIATRKSKPLEVVPV